MKTFELRKIVVVGCRFDAPDGAPLLDSDGLPVSPLRHPMIFRVAFWIPQLPPYQRRGIRKNPNPPPRDALQDPLEGYTIVNDVLGFELTALNDGAILEEVYDFNYSKQPSVEQLRKDLMPIWEKRTFETLGSLPNRPPIDKDIKPSVEFTAI